MLKNNLDIARDSTGKVAYIHFKINDTWATVPFNPHSKTFDESSLITKQLRIWEKEFGAIDLSDLPPDPPPSNPAIITTEYIAEKYISDHEKSVNHPLATGSSTGMMSAADKLKLDGIRSAASRDASAFEQSGVVTTAIAAHISSPDPHPNYLLESVVGASGGVAPLDSNLLIPEAFLPAIAITDTFVVNTQAAMLSLNAQRGDVAVRSDLNKTFILKSAPPSSLANWQELPTPTDQVLSVNGKSGVVVLSAADLSAVGLAGDQVIEGLKAFTGILRAQGPVDEALKGISRIDLGVQNGTARFILESRNLSGTGSTIWEFDNQDGILRIYLPNQPPRWTLDQSGNLAIFGALSVGTAALAATTRTNLGIATTTTVAIALSAANGWSAISGFGAVEVTKGTTGWCHCEGALSKTLQPTKGETVGTLPAGYRPKKRLRFPSVGTSSANSEPYLEVDTAGVITYNNAGTIPATGSTITLSSIGFYAAA
jgi:hypothetical protein